MKFNNKTKKYTASNVSFDSVKIEAVSYDWWSFVTRYHGKTLFNQARYSATTQKHQRKVQSLMGRLAIKIDLTLRFTKLSLTDPEEALRDELNILAITVGHLKIEIENPRSRAAKNELRKAEIKRLRKEARAIKKILNGAKQWTDKL